MKTRSNFCIIRPRTFGCCAVTLAILTACGTTVSLGPGAGSATDAGINVSPPKSDAGSVRRTDARAPIDVASVAICGNAVREFPETCDDGNAASGDGCGANCTAERYYVCTGTGPGSCVLYPTSWRSQAYIKASNTEPATMRNASGPSLPGEHFGAAVALSADGNTMAVAAPEEYSSASGVGGDQANNRATGSGAVYVYLRTSGVWQLQSYIKATNTDSNKTDDLTNDGFGTSLALSADGSTLLVGAPREDSDARGVDGNQENNSASDAGAAYLYVRSGETWSAQAYLKATNAESGDGFGASVAISSDGSRLAVGAPGEDSAAIGVGGDQTSNAAEYSGAVYTYSRAAGVWRSESYFKASNAERGDEFGHSVALSADGHVLAVGATREDSDARGINGNQGNGPTPNDNSGAVYTYMMGEAWSTDAYIKASDTDGQDWFGSDVALSSDGRTLAVGAYFASPNDTRPGRGEGAAYVYARTGVQWAEQARLGATSFDGKRRGLAQSLALSADGGVLVLGAVSDDSRATDVGGDPEDIDPINAETWTAGAAYVFSRDGALWKNHTYLKASNTGGRDQFGGAAAISGDGLTIAVGAVRESSNARGVNGNQANNSTHEAGAAYVFAR